MTVTVGTRTDGSYGRTKSDANAPTDLDTQYQSSNFNNIADALIALEVDHNVSSIRGLHVSDGDTECLYQLDGDLTDSGPNALTNLVNVASPQDAAGQVPATQSLFCSAGNFVNRAAHDTELAITGAFSMMFGYRLEAYDTGNDNFMVSFGGDITSSAEAENLLWGVYMSSSNNTLTYIHQEGAGANNTVGATGFRMPLFERLHIGIDRVSGGLVTIYVNGDAVGSGTPATATPTGGTNAVIKIGSGGSGATHDTGIYSSVQVRSATRTAQDFADAAQRMIG